MYRVRVVSRFGYCNYTYVANVRWLWLARLCERRALRHLKGRLLSRGIERIEKETKKKRKL